MEMAAAHGLAQRLVEMTGLDRINRNEFCEFISEEDKIIKTWFALSSRQIFRKLDFFNLLRKTLVFVLTESPLKEIKKKELLKVVSIYFNTFSSMLKNNVDIRKPVIDIILEPWKNVYFSWDELFQKKITIRDLKVQEYFCAEPEEIVLARVHVFLMQGKEEMAMSLAKNSFLFHSRVAKHFSREHKLNQKNASLSTKYKKGTASMDWYLFILQKKKNLPSIIHEVKQLTCHEGILLIQRLRQNKRNQSFAFTLLHIIFMQELIRPSKFCCTKKIFCLWCIMHKEKKTSMDAIIQEIRKMVAMHAPSSAHFYLLVDALWKQFGSSFITVYVELYVRGLTVDINHLEAAKNGEIDEDVSYLECHIASMFAKLSTLFSDFHDGAARECMFSAFSLKPTKERLYILQSLTHSILSAENEMKLNSSLSDDSASLQECRCVVRCSGSCSSIKEYFLEHPILMKGISNVPYSVVKDLVSVLEGVRCIRFQYNMFDWHNNATDIGDYLKDFNLAKSWESDTEYASEGSVKSDIEESSPINDSLYQSPQTDVGLLHQPVKRKSESDDKKGIHSLDVGANIEVTNDEFVNKRIKVQDQNMNNEMSKHDIFNAIRKPVQNFRSPLGMEDAIENVIRMTLDNNRQTSDIPSNNGHNILLNTALNHANDGTEKLSLSSIYKPVSGNHVYPYSLTTYGKKTDYSSDFKTSECASLVKSSSENSANYGASFASKPLCLNQALITPVVSRESVISPVVNKPKALTTCQQMTQSKVYPVKTQNASYSRSDETSSAINIAKKVPVYHQETLNLGSKNSMYEQARSTFNSATQSSQFISNQTTVQVLCKSDISAVSDISKTQFSSNTSVASSSSMTSPVNVIHSKGTVAAQQAGYPSSSQCVSKSSVYRADSRYQVDKSSIANTVVKRVEQSIACFQDNNFVHCDRSSVIQHTMQHVRESHMQLQPNDIEIPNQLSVSLNSNAIEQIRSAPKNDIANLPPFTVNVNDRTISNSSVAVSASLVIPRKPQTQIDLASQPVCSSHSSVNNSETITIPGILASQSVIVSPWEAQRKSHGELLYKKNANAINTSSIDKRIYKNRPPQRQIILKPEPKVCGRKVPSDKGSSTQVFKALVHPSHISSPFPTHPSSNQSNANTSQVWSFVNNSSSQGVSRPTSSQPWYSEPYPKSYSSGNNGSKPGIGINPNLQQNSSSVSKPLQLTKHTVDIKPLTMYSKSVHPSGNSSVSSTVPYSPSNTISSSSTTSSVLNNFFSSPNSNLRPVSNENTVCTDFVSPSSPSFHPNNRVNLKVYGSGNNPVKKNVGPSGQQTSAMQLTTSTVQQKNPVQYTAPGVIGTNLHYSQIASKGFSCCSPSEVNPCQNCSLPAENSVVQSSGENISVRHPEQMIPGGDKMMSDDNDLTSAAPCDLKTSNKCTADGLVLSDSTVNQTINNCQYCSHPFLANELEMHILNSHSKELGIKSSNFIGDINSDVMTLENRMKSLPVVPEQDSLFLRESFDSDLPHHKTFENIVENQQNIVEDDKNLDEIEAHAFSACMDLINNDKELKRIVQGIDPFHQMDNNYLPFIPSNDSSNNFLETNLPDQEHCPLQISTANDQTHEMNSFAQYQQTKLPEKVEVDKSLNCVFEFTEKELDSSKPVQKLIHSKVQSSYSERISALTSKTSNELTFSALAEMIKVTMTGDSHNGLESVEASSKEHQKDSPHTAGNSQRVIYEWSCSLCSKKLKSAWSLKRHIKKLHSDLPIDDAQINASRRMINISTNMPDNATNIPDNATNIPDNDIQFENDKASKSGNSFNESSDSLNRILQSDVKLNLEISGTSEMCGVLPKGRIKGIIKSPTSPCKFCGKVLTSVYMKKHIFKQHQEIIKKADSSSSDVNMDVNVSTPSKMDSANISPLSPLLEQDIDSSTCLSMSDALKRNNPFTVAETSNFSEDCDKLAENTDIKFNFNVLEFSKDTKMRLNPSALEEDTSLKLGQPQRVNEPQFDGHKVKCNIPCNDRVKFIYKQCCHLCSKAYTSVAALKKHLKSVHDFVDPTKSKTLTNSVGSGNDMKNTDEAQHLQSNLFDQVSYSKRENFKTAYSNTAAQMSRAAPLENVSSPYNVDALDQKAKDKFKVSLPNMNRSLLRAVLKSNFVSKQLEKKDCGESKEIVSQKRENTNDNGKSNSCDNYGNLEGQYSVHRRDTNYPHANYNFDSLKRGTPDPEFKCGNESCTPVPLDSLSKIHLSGDTTASSYALLPDTKIINHSSTSKIESSHLNKNSDRTDKVTKIKYTNHTNSQNLSIQSNEISPISEIISNVSKCHFGGTSNIDNKECFEDNSLKLLIPENQDESLSKKNEESRLQSDMPKLVQNQELFPQKENVVNISNVSEVSSIKSNGLIVNDHISSDEGVLENEPPELVITADRLDADNTKSIPDDQNLSMMDFSSTHLKEVHDQSRIPELVQEQVLPALKEETIVNISDESDVSFRKLNDSTVSDIISSEGEILDNESCNLESAVRDSAENSTRCRLCHQYLSSMDILSKHLKEVHDIPVLKKHISHPCSPELSTCFQEPSKLSPPKLKLGTNESDSESASGLDDNHLSWSKTTNFSSEHDISQNGALSEDNLCESLSPLPKQGDQDEETLLQNSQPKLKTSVVPLELEETESEPSRSRSLTVQLKNCQHLYSGHEPSTTFSINKSESRKNSLCDIFSVVREDLNSLTKRSRFSTIKSESRRHSLCDIFSIFSEDLNPLPEKSKHSFFDFKNISLKDVKQKSVSLPNIKLSLNHETHNHNEVQCANYTEEENKQLKPSAGENTTFSCVTDVTEICKSSSDSSSSQNFPTHWSKITIKAPFSANPLIRTSIVHHKRSRRKGMSRRKIFSKLKSKSIRENKIKRASRGNYFPFPKKFKTKKTFKPIILTLKEATEISEFLKTHKQPTVKLIRLKEEEESNCALNEKDDPVPDVICNKYNIKEAVVKLERMQIPKDFRKVVVIKQELLVPNILSEDTHTNSVTTENQGDQSDNCPNDFYLDSSNADISHSENSVTQENPSKESIELSIINELDSNTASSDSIQFLGSEKNYSIKSNEFCTSPLKKCFVVLNRISV